MIAFPEAVAADSAHLDPDSIAHDLGPDGPIAAAMEQYEDRPAQREMASAIAEFDAETAAQQRPALLFGAMVLDVKL